MNMASRFHMLFPPEQRQRIKKRQKHDDLSALKAELPIDGKKEKEVCLELQLKTQVLRIGKNVLHC